MRPVRPPHPFSMYKENKSKGGSHENNEPDYYFGRDDGAHCSWAGRDCGRGEARSKKSRGNSQNGVESCGKKNKEIAEKSRMKKEKTGEDGGKKNKENDQTNRRETRERYEST